MDKELDKELAIDELNEKAVMHNDLEQLKLNNQLKKESTSNNIERSRSNSEDVINYARYAIKNPVASWIKIIAIIEVFFGIYIISGFGIMGFIISLASATIMWGFAETIQILHDIRKNTSK